MAMAGIFISYRRADSGSVCGRITDSLRAVFGNDAVFRDVSDIPGGMDFRRAIDAALDRCKTVVVVIGPAWVTATDQASHRRLDNPEDPVRVEVELALQRRIPILPVLVWGARMPDTRELPSSIAQLHYLNAYSLYDDPYYQPSMNRLVEAIAYFNPLLPTDQSRLQQQANAAYIEASRLKKQAAPVVKTFATGAAILQIIIALIIVASGIGSVVAASGIAQFVSQILGLFQQAPDPSVQGMGQSASGVFSALLVIGQVTGCRVAIVGLIWAITVFVALVRAARRCPA